MTHQPLIRKAKPEDLVYIQQCAQEAYKKYVERLGKKPAPMVADFAQQIDNGLIDVLLLGSTLVAYIVYYGRGDNLHIENVAVHPEFSNRGLGRQLVDYAEQVGIDRHFCGVELYTNVKMTENLHWYSKLGYQEVDRRVEEGFERIYLRKALDIKEE